MLQVDTRAGSADLIEPLTERSLPVHPVQMEFGDFAWVGQGPGGRPVTVAVELKTIEDVLACITNGRFAGHQLPGLQQTYEVVYLIIEGRWTVGAGRELRTLQHGRFQVHAWSGREWKFEALDNWITTMEIKAGVRVRRTMDHAETVQTIHDLYSWWTAGEYIEHRSHLVTYLGGDLTDRVWTMRAPDLARMLMAGVKGLGEQRARAVAAKFGCMEVVVKATEAELQEVDGIGPKLAKEIKASMWSVK